MILTCRDFVPVGILACRDFGFRDFVPYPVKKMNKSRLFLCNNIIKYLLLNCKYAVIRSVYFQTKVKDFSKIEFLIVEDVPIRINRAPFTNIAISFIISEKRR